MITIKPHEQLIMLITYHTPEINQASIKKNLNNLGFSSKDLQTDHIRSYESYISRCTPFEQDIAAIFLRYRNASGIYLSNKYLATLVGCSRRTVTRTTNKFHKDGFITKHQPNKYSSNHYTLHEKIKTGSTVFMHRFNSLSEEQQDIYISHGIIVDHKNKKICSDVTPNKNSLLLDSLSSKNVVVSSRMRARITPDIKKTSYQKRGNKMNSVQKQLILDHRYDPRVKDMLNNPSIKSHIITESIQKIASIMALDEKEQFKLTAFTDETVEYVYTEVEAAIKHNKNRTIQHRMEWLISFAISYCNDNNIKPDWKWYYEVCDIIGMDPKTERKPFVMPSHKKSGGIYKGKVSGWKKIEEIADLEAKVNKWQSEVKKLESQRIALAGPDPFNLKGLLERSIERARQELEESEQLLRESNYEKQILQNQHKSDWLETCVA